jgi:UDP-N-acetyl-D-glucosamine dehydrogenase
MVKNKTKSVAIIGQGYVGLPLAISLVSAGWSVSGIDISEVTVDRINKKIKSDTVTAEELTTTFESNRYFCTSDFSSIADASVVVICVPTPLDENFLPDYTFLELALVEISRHISDGTLIISESTSSPGTLRKTIAPQIYGKANRVLSNIHFAIAPERVNPGDNVWNQRNTPRIVAGLDKHATKLAFEFYSQICDVVLPSESPEEVEAAKLLENTFRLINISFINEFAMICRMMNIDPINVVKLAGSKPFGFMSFTPGIGVGGHCIPVDPIYFSEWAKSKGQVARTIELAVQINREIPKAVCQRALELIGSIKIRPKILVLGMSYKFGISDTRESPSIAIINELQRKGIEVVWHDPLVAHWKNTRSVPLDTECDLIIIAQDQIGVDYDLLCSFNTIILNCTQRKLTGPRIHNF